MNFSLVVDQFAKKTSLNLYDVNVGIKMKLFQHIIQYTRVDTGRLRGNWQTSTGHPIRIETDRLDPMPQGSPGGQAWDEVNDVVRGDTVDYMTNNLPYAVVWEEQDGMVAKNMERIERNIKEAISDVS